MEVCHNAEQALKDLCQYYGRAKLEDRAFSKSHQS